MKAKLAHFKDKLVCALNKLNSEHLLACFGFFILILVIGTMIISPISASASNEDATMVLKAGTYKFIDKPNVTDKFNYTILCNMTIGTNTGTIGGFAVAKVGNYNQLQITDINGTGVGTGIYYYDLNTHEYVWANNVFGTAVEEDAIRTHTIPTDAVVDDTFGTWYIANTNYNDVNGVTPPVCPTLEEQIADYDGSWYMFEQMLKANNYELWMKYSAELLDIGSIEYSKGLSQGYQNGFLGALSGNNVEDPIDQYWNSTKEYVLIAGQPYFAPNGFGAIDAYDTIGIYGEHESKLHKQDGSTQVFNGQYVTEFASAGTLGGGWYKIGATVGDEYAYEQSFNVSAMDKAYYVSRVSPLGDPVEEFLVAIWLDSYEAWYVAEEFAHFGTVANNDKSYKQVYSIYITDISPTSQRFINYDNPTLHETFNEDINATLYLATFNQLNNYNIYTDDIGIVESYNNGYDAGANTKLWTDLISQPVVAFFSIPLAQVIIEGVTYTLTYGVVLGAGIVALIVIWFLKLFAGG